jgi:hypothetical protein
LAAGHLGPTAGLGRQILLWGEGFMRDKTTMNDLGMLRRRRDDGLGPNSDIGNKLRALYGAVQNEEIPSRFIDLLEQLDAVEKRAKPAKGE